MKKVLITLLLIANVCSGTAFAWDKYSITALERGTAVSGLVADVNSNLVSDAHANDHCTHGAAHLVGIFYDHSLQTIPATPNHQVSTLVPLASQYVSPLLRPPIV